MLEADLCRPKEFAPIVYSDEEDSDSNVGKMPPSP